MEKETNRNYQENSVGFAYIAKQFPEYFPIFLGRGLPHPKTSDNSDVKFY